MQSDEGLARGIQQGQADALAALVERHHSALMGYLYRMTGSNRRLAEDLAQETFLRVLRSIAQYQYPRPFKPWLYAIATNIARDHYKRADTRLTTAMPDELISDSDPLPEDAFMQADEARHIVAAIASLPDHQREAIILRYYQNLSLNEIAEALHIPLGTVKSRLWLAIRTLKHHLERELS